MPIKTSRLRGFFEGHDKKCGHQLGRPTCDGLLAGRAPLGEELAEAVRAVGLVIPAIGDQT